MKAVYLFISLSISLLACGSEEENSDRIVFENDDISIELIDVEDSRCPTQVQCIWEGDAIVTMSILSDETSGTFSLNSNQNVEIGQFEIELFGYLIQLIDVSPYPETATSEISLEDYRITLDVKPI